MPSQADHLCPECRVGHLKSGRVSYFSWSQGFLLTVPDFPAWVCDICGWYIYDRVALAEVDAMLHSDRSSDQGRPEASLGREADFTVP